MSDFLIRPHHMLCLQFFEGKGYSDGFVANMAAVKHSLEETNPKVKIVKGTDDICADCPKNQGGKCINEESVLEHDERVYAPVIERIGSGATWQEIAKAIREEIIENGKMQQVCGECQWSDICFRA